ncbi:hypothetical protein PRIPAC_78085 [Pristionchus pacificus]|uniref:Uncharacterized protein n=1 Tax=Pristionchus pacificus TaxID=54126 RepID=A0A2A6BYP3_PRIPA|nr:hypothetical protein PRIPAC_78085 [Pristionchus pacificus]|eukprot:PDM71064.1 hypothetical protein PRIPAC_44460 [Pristionchus pacificus]
MWFSWKHRPFCDQYKRISNRDDHVKNSAEKGVDTIWCDVRTAADIVKRKEKEWKQNKKDKEIEAKKKRMVKKEGESDNWYDDFFNHEEATNGYRFGVMHKIYL